MYRNRMNRLGLLTLSITASALVIGMVGCSGDTDGGNAANQDFSGTEFVADDDSVGTIDLQVDDTGTVGTTDGFRVYVKDSNGNPVRDIKVSCDTEAGLALIEPTSGLEQTDDNGQISGVVGCEAPGSYQIGCRLPIGGNRRDFETIRCSGSIPDGFDGFPGAGGGSLGGGQQTNDDGGTGGTDTAGVDIVSITVTDGPIEQTLTVDTNQTADCDTTDNTANDPEPFGDALFAIEVVNDSNSTVLFTSYSFTVPSVGTFGPFGLNSPVSPGGAKVTVSGILALAQAGTKLFPGAGSAISGTTGFKNVTFTLEGSNDLDEDVALTGAVGLNFSNVNRCTVG